MLESKQYTDIGIREIINNVYIVESIEKAGISSEKYAKIPAERVMGMAIGNPITPFFPPADRRITSATLWVTVFDNFIGELLRPRGSDLVEMKLFLSIDFSS